MMIMMTGVFICAYGRAPWCNLWAFCSPGTVVVLESIMAFCHALLLAFNDLLGNKQLDHSSTTQTIHFHQQHAAILIRVLAVVWVSPLCITVSR